MAAFTKLPVGTPVKVDVHWQYDMTLMCTMHGIVAQPMDKLADKVCVALSHCIDAETGKRTEVRGYSWYEGRRVVVA